MSEQELRAFGQSVASQTRKPTDSIRVYKPVTRTVKAGLFGLSKKEITANEETDFLIDGWLLGSFVNHERENYPAGADLKYWNHYYCLMKNGALKVLSTHEEHSWSNEYAKTHYNETKIGAYSDMNFKELAKQSVQAGSFSAYMLDLERGEWNNDHDTPFGLYIWRRDYPFQLEWSNDNGNLWCVGGRLGRFAHAPGEGVRLKLQALQSAQ